MCETIISCSEAVNGFANERTHLISEVWGVWFSRIFETAAITSSTNVKRIVGMCNYQAKGSLGPSLVIISTDALLQLPKVSVVDDNNIAMYARTASMVYAHTTSRLPLQANNGWLKAIAKLPCLEILALRGCGKVSPSDFHLSHAMFYRLRVNSTGGLPSKLRLGVGLVLKSRP